MLAKYPVDSFATKLIQHGKQGTAASALIAMITSWQQSSQSQQDYCRQHNIAYHVFHYWYKVYRQQHATSGAFFVTLNISPQLQANVELQFADGKRIVFHQPVSADFLKALIA